MRVLTVIGAIGRLLRLFSLAFLLPVLMALLDGDHPTALHFGLGLAACLAAGLVLAWLSPLPVVFHRSEALAVVAGSWLMVAQAAAVPFMLQGMSWEDAFFESMSGFTTTGATVVTDFRAYGRAFFLWRALAHWLGGLGVIALFVVVLPRLGIAGRQLFFAEASEISEPISPQIHQNARRLWLLYTILTLVQTLLLVLTGFPVYDALVHSMATLAAGGFSPHPESVGGYHNPGAEWVCVVFMILGGTSFTLQWKAFTSRPGSFFRDGEFLFYLGSTVAGSVAVAICLQGWRLDLDVLRTGAFQCASLISSTGFASVDYNLWNDGAKAILVVMMLISGCAGSAAGGPKAIRILLVLRLLWREIKQVIHPYGVVPIRYGKKVIPPPVVRSVFVLVALYIIAYLIIGVGVVLTGTDLTTGFTASLACVGNIGPGFNAVGPMANYAGLPWMAKLLLTLGMWIGRLEIMTVLALLHPDVWRNLSFRRVPPGAGGSATRPA